MTIPDYNENECQDGRFGIFQIHGNAAGDVAPNLWSQAPQQQNKLWILDVDGTRLVILAGYPPTSRRRTGPTSTGSSAPFKSGKPPVGLTRGVDDLLRSARSVGRL